MKNKPPRVIPVSSLRQQRGGQRRANRVLLCALSFIVCTATIIAAGSVFSEHVSKALAALQQQGGNDGQGRASDPVQAEAVPEGGEVAPSDRTAQPDGRIQVLVELNDAPTTHVYAATLEKSSLPRDQAEAIANQAAQAQLNVIERAQDTVASVMNSRFDTTEIYRVQRVLNGIAVEIDASQIEVLRRTPGVRAVNILIPETIGHTTSVPFLRVPELWDNTLGIRADLTGRNMRVGIIDTGIDYLHANFGGTGAQAEYEANDRTIATDTRANGARYFPTAKVVGGRDFAGDRYNAGATSNPSTGTRTPAPDDDPMDCNSHGTHVAGTAGGFGVNANGTTYTGEYGRNTPFSSLRIGPGTAPQAQLFALRVFGCTGSTNLSAAALEFSTDPDGNGNFSDRLDVVNLSLGSNYGSGFNPTETAMNNAALAGVVSVASAGNSGDSYFITGAPGTAPRALSVAASVDSGIQRFTLIVNSPEALAGEKPAASVQFGPAPNGQTADVVVANDGNATGTGASATDACQPLVNAAAVSGKIALVDRGICSIKTKTLNAQNAGAIGVLVANNVASGISPPGYADDPTITTPITIPTLSILQGDGNGIKASIAAGNAVNVTMGSGISQQDTLASFSSRGPRRGTQPILLKPDIAAPGLNITSSQTGIQASGTVAGTVTIVPNSQTLTISGTSMASPHMAGIMALLRQLHPDWSVEELKASAMNGAINDIYVNENRTGGRYGPGRIGAGRVDAPTSATNPAIAFNADEAGVVSVSSFENEVVGTVTGRTRTLRVVNKGSTPVTYTLGLDTIVDAPGVAFSLPGGNSITVPGGQTRTITVQMNAVADQMDHTRDSTVSAFQGNPRQWLTEEAAYVTFTANAQLRMRVPVYATPRPASTMTATDVIVTGGATSGQTALALAGQDVCTGTRPGSIPDCQGTFPTDVVSLVTPFELQVSDPADPNVPSFADLRYAGVSYDGANLLFGISTYGDWTWPRDVGFDITIDTNEDGVDDFILFNTATTVGGQPTDVYVSALFNIRTGTTTVSSFINGVSSATRDTAIFNNNVMFLPIPAASLGLGSGDTTFRYKIEAFGSGIGRTDSAGVGAVGSADAPFTYNFAAPGVSFPFNPANPNNSGILFADINTRTIPVNFNSANLTNNRSLGALLLHHHNARNTRAEVVLVQGSSPASTDFAVSASVSNPRPALNENVVFNVNVSNVGSTDGTNVRVRVDVPSGILLTASNTSSGAFDEMTGIWTIPTLARGATATLQITGSVRTTDLSAFTARFAGADQLDLNSANDQASVSVNAPRTADVGITLTASSATATNGGTVTYTATVTNAGEDPAFNIVVTNAVTPAGARILSGSASSGFFNPATGVWNIASLGKGSSATLTFTVTIGADVCGSGTTTATVTSETADPNTMNNTASTTFTVPSAFSFSAATVTAGEGDRVATITVTRRDATAGGVSVDYETFDSVPSTTSCASASNGNASDRCDYTTARGTLRFNAGETQKTFTVLLTDDARVEGSESFGVRLFNPVGATACGTGTSATVTITDNDTNAAAANPIDNAEFFVRQQYIDFLNRQPDAPGLAFWVSEITSCTTATNRRPGETEAQCVDRKRVNTSAAFFLSSEFQNTGYSVYLIYKGSLNRQPTYREFIADMRRVAEGIVVNDRLSADRIEANKQAFANEFVMRTEFRNRYGGLTNEEFIDQLFRTIQVTPTTDERSQLVASLNVGGASRASILRRIVDATRIDSNGNLVFADRYSKVFYDREFNPAFVLFEYFGYLRRDPDAAGYAFWLAKLNEFNGDFVAAQMVRAFIISTEYRSRFGQP